MSISGFTVGIVCHNTYRYLDLFFPGRTFHVVMKKVVLDQLVCSPMYISTFFATMAFLEDSSIKQFVDEMNQKAWKLYVAECAIWPPAQETKHLSRVSDANLTSNAGGWIGNFMIQATIIKVENWVQPCFNRLQGPSCSDQSQDVPFFRRREYNNWTNVKRIEGSASWRKTSDWLSLSRHSIH
uniref:Uncharacterized protein n=1 Tax=Timema cristinae TaxID=61476 RepID=A0A7R9GSB3_TIMCR|nr:unnamed protein product [Timema cristinae]